MIRMIMMTCIQLTLKSAQEYCSNHHSAYYRHTFEIDDNYDHDVSTGKWIVLVINVQSRPQVHLWWPRSHVGTLAALAPETEIKIISKSGKFGTRNWNDKKSSLGSCLGLGLCFAYFHDYLKAAWLEMIVMIIVIIIMIIVINIIIIVINIMIIMIIIMTIVITCRQPDQWQMRNIMQIRLKIRMKRAIDFRTWKQPLISEPVISEPVTCDHWSP